MNARLLRQMIILAIALLAAAAQAQYEKGAGLFIVNAGAHFVGWQMVRRHQLGVFELANQG